MIPGMCCPLASCLGGSLRACRKSLEDSKGWYCCRGFGIAGKKGGGWDERGQNQEQWFLICAGQFGYFWDKARSFIRWRGFCSNTDTWGNTGWLSYLYLQFYPSTQVILIVRFLKVKPGPVLWGVSFGDLGHSEARTILFAWSVIVIFSVCLFWQAALILWDPFLPTGHCLQTAKIKYMWINTWWIGSVTVSGSEICPTSYIALSLMAA